MTPAAQACLVHIVSIATKFGYPVRPPATEEALASAAEIAKTQFRVSIPDVLYQFWRQHDGLMLGSYRLYSATKDSGTPHLQDIFNISLDCWLEVLGDIQFFYIGHSDLDAYGYDYKRGKWSISFRGTLDPIEQFDDTDLFFQRVLETILEDQPQP